MACLFPACPTRRRLILTGLGFLLPYLLVQSARASFQFNDPSNIKTADIDSSHVTMNQSAGNVSLATFNQLATTYVFSLDTPRSSVTNDNLPAALNLTSATSGIALNATINATGSGYAVFTTASAGDTTYSTSGTASIATTRPTITIAMTQGVKGVAFTLNRLIGDATVTLYDASNDPVGNTSGYTITGNPAHSFFGFVGGAADHPITKVQIVYPGGNQVGLDDVSFTNSAVPAPASASITLLGGGLLLMIRHKQRRGVATDTRASE